MRFKTSVTPALTLALSLGERESVSTVLAVLNIVVAVPALAVTMQWEFNAEAQRRRGGKGKANLAGGQAFTNKWPASNYQKRGGKICAL